MLFLQKQTSIDMIFRHITQELLQVTGIPETMNNPFDYEPHPLCIEVCKELQSQLQRLEDWREEIEDGKMFGVLIVEKPSTEENADGKSQIGYLAAYSGQIGGRSDWQDFVPAVFDYLQPDGYFKTHEAEITHINHSISLLKGDERMQKARVLIAQLQQERSQVILRYQERIKEAKAKRDARRQEALLDPEHKALSTEEEAAMTKESQYMKAELRRLKKSLSEKTSLETEYAAFQENILHLKQLRKTLSDTLQQWLFSQFRMLNYRGEREDLLEIFQMMPPAGSGECCEPKLLQYAYEHGYQPLQMAMFWWGKSPREEIRHHLQYYPACNGKCKPILKWMLPNSIFETCTRQSDIYNKVETLFEDQEIAIICKPEGLLSVPGKDASQPSVYALMRKKFPETASPLIVHRLDMATSGLMIIAKTEFAHHRLQQQFLFHRVKKKYIAIIGCKDQEACDKMMKEVSSNETAGKVAHSKKLSLSLPLMPDYLDRPRQIVNHEQGKEAITEYEVLERIDDTHLRLALYPKTGRTHQLRVHCAHQDGLDAPILGDPLYGNEQASRLYLHAEEITFEHPLTGEKITITRKADF